MSDDSDVMLAQALWDRAKKFAKANDYENALLDVSASYRLFGHAKDSRFRSVHEDWVLWYAAHQKQPKPHLESSPDAAVMAKVSQLESILEAFKSKRRQ